MAVSSAVRTSLSSSMMSALPCMPCLLSSVGFGRRLGGRRVPRPRVDGFGGLVEELGEGGPATPTASAGAAAGGDVVDRPGARRDRGLDGPIGHRLACTDEHRHLRYPKVR